MNLGKNLSRIMKDKGLSLAALAKAAGVSKQTIHGWTAGRRVHDVAQLKKVATVLFMICFLASRIRLFLPPRSF